jgi:hypothetical protein
MASSGKANMTPRKQPIASPVRAVPLRDFAPAMRPTRTQKPARLRPIQKTSGITAATIQERRVGGRNRATIVAGGKVEEQVAEPAADPAA